MSKRRSKLQKMALVLLAVATYAVVGTALDAPAGEAAEMEFGGMGFNYVFGTAAFFVAMVLCFWFIAWMDKNDGLRRVGVWLKAVLLGGGAYAEPRRRK